MNKLQIIDIYWDRIYLHILFNQEITGNQIYLNSLNNKKTSILSSNHFEIIINITNFKDRKMLENENWFFKIKQNNEFIPIPISLDVGKKLAHLDKVYRYGGSNYAYIVTFSPKRDEELYCCLTTTFMMKNKKPKTRNIKIESHSLKQRMKRNFVYNIEKFNNLIFKVVSKLTKKTGKRVLLMSESRVPISGNLLALDKRLKERKLTQSLQISYYFKNTRHLSNFKMMIEWLKLAFICGKQDYIFVDDYCPFFKCIDIEKDKSITFVQVWHAGMGFKAVGYGRFGLGGKAGQYPYESSHRKYDYAIVGGERLRPSYAEAYGMNVEDCLPYGLMRIDGYLDENKINNFKKTFYQEYPQFKDKKIILFAPTFRGNGQRTAYYPYHQLDLQKIYDMCKDEYVFLFKMHPYIKELITNDAQYQDRICEFSSYKDLESLFYITDILITDFSSNIYEFALFKKPIVFYAFDQDEYEFTRTVHSPLETCAPGKICHTIDEIVECIKTKDFEMNKLYKFLEENYNKDQALASDLVIDNIILKNHK